MREDDEVFTRQLRAESFGPWPHLRKMLLGEGVDPNTVRVHRVPHGGHGSPPEGELFEFRTPSERFSAHVKWRYPKGDASISGWRRESQS